MKRFARILGSFLAGGGLLLLVWALVVWQWQDPFTSLYTHSQQNRLAVGYESLFVAYRPPAMPKPDPVVSLAAERARIAREARAYRQRLEAGDPLGRLKVPRLGLNQVLVAGTDSGSLTKGPGWYSGSFLPGEGELIYIAGHRTTYGAPFARIDSLRPGDQVTIEVPYGTFVYRVRGHAIVPADDVDRLRSRGREVVALQACHPRFFATQRYIVYARPVRVIPRRGRPYALEPRGPATTA